MEMEKSEEEVGFGEKVTFSLKIQVWIDIRVPK